MKCLYVCLPKPTPHNNACVKANTNIWLFSALYNQINRECVVFTKMLKRLTLSTRAYRFLCNNLGPKVFGFEMFLFLLQFYIVIVVTM